jgi:NDP-sugar pyrophosphorylase family protein
MPLSSDMPVLELLLRQLRRDGVTRVTLAVNHFHQLIHAYFGDGDRLGVDLSYHVEDMPLGTAGPLASIPVEPDEPVLVLNGDLLTTLDFRALAEDHCRSGATATIAAVRRQIPLEFGVLSLSPDDALVSYDEKPTLSHVVSMGCYLLSGPLIARFVRPGAFLNMPDLFREMLAAGVDVHVHVTDAFWLDIGRPDDYAVAQAEFARAPGRFLRTDARP